MTHVVPEESPQGRRVPMEPELTQQPCSSRHYSLGKSLPSQTQSGKDKQGSGMTWDHEAVLHSNKATIFRKLLWQLIVGCDSVQLPSGIVPDSSFTEVTAVQDKECGLLH